MFIRRTAHTDNKNGGKYFTYKLVESIRTDRGPRQRPLLNLGADFSLAREDWSQLANRIEAIISGQLSLFPVPPEIDQMAHRYAKAIIRRHGQRSEFPAEEQCKADFQTVDINSVESEQIRSVGGESVVLAAIRELQLDSELERLGFNQSNIEAAIGVISARMLSPSSERATHMWLQGDTSLDDLMETSFEPLSQDRVYQVSDRLLKNKEAIETHLQNQEKHLFNLEEKILLYDLTNTFFEGSGKYNNKAHFGVSKEKRTDCPLVTLALLMDGDGFPKKSQILEGNISEPKTLQKILPTISTATKRPIVVTDAGIGTQENVQWMSDNGYSYIVVSRQRQLDIPGAMEMITVREDDNRVVSAAARINSSGETEVYCHSTAKEIKEREIKSRFEQQFEDELAKISKAIHKKHGTKKYEKVLEKIGRLKERYRRVSRRYEISIEKEKSSKNVTGIHWKVKQTDDTCGYYMLRSNLTDTAEKEIFDIFNMLLNVEEAFRSMKSELGFRPINHQNEYRCDGHLFITVIAYHVLHSIRLKLKAQGITYSWSTIRRIMATHYRVTTSMKRSDGKMIYIRKTAKPEDCHIKIYNALGLPHRPGKIAKIIL